MDLVDTVLEEVLKSKPVPVEFMEDNESTVAIIKSGKKPTMRHIQRTRVCLLSGCPSNFDVKEVDLG